MNLDLPAPGPRKYLRVGTKARDKFTAAVVAEYVKGGSIRQIAVRFGASYGMIHKIISESGTPKRERGGANRKKRAAV